MSTTNGSSAYDPFSNMDPRELQARVEAASPSELDSLSFGVIRLDDADNVIFFSRTEARQSGFGDRTAVGKKFWTELAPCMGTPEFLRRLEQAKRAGTLDLTFEQIGDFDDAERQLQVRMIAASRNGVWVFVRRPEAR
jgi:photoactive yellow protein